MVKRGGKEKEARRRRRRRGGGGREVRLKTDQQPERLNTTACLRSRCPLGPLPLKLLRAVGRDNGSFPRVSLGLYHTRARARPPVRTSRRRWIVRKSWRRVSLRAEPGTEGRAALRRRPKLGATPKLRSVDGTFRLFSHIERWFSPCLRELDNPRPSSAALFHLLRATNVCKWSGGGGEGKESLL